MKILILVICAAIVAILALWLLPPYQVRSARRRYGITDISGSDLLKAENDRRSTLAQIIGGIVILLGLYFTGQSLKLQQDGQMTDRINKAVEQLGSEKPEVMLGGIYQIGRISRDSDRDHWAMLTILDSFVEQHAPYAFGEHAAKFRPCDPMDEYDPSLLPDHLTQAVINTLRYQPVQDSSDRQANVSIIHADLHDVDLSDAVLGNAQLSGNNFTGAVLRNVSLSKGASMSYARLAYADLTHAEMSGTNLNHVCFVHAHLSGTKLRGANLSHADFRNLMEAKGADFSGADLTGAVFEYADVRGADFTGAVGLATSQFDHAMLDCTTALPPGLTNLRGPCANSPGHSQ